MSEHATLNQTLRRLGLVARTAANTMERRIFERGECVYTGTAQMVWHWLRESGRLKYVQPPSVHQVIRRAMNNSDQWCIEIVYRDAKKRETRRVVSPIRLANDDRTLVALCIGREEPRFFTIRNIVEIRLVDSAEVLMGEDRVEEMSDGQA